MGKSRWTALHQRIVNCEKCPRLRKHCQKVATEKRKAFRDQEYWGRPVANFGSANVELLIVGLAPGAHGANRTGRMFTGDRSGDWLYRALHRAGFANQPTATGLDDGLKLTNCTITNICHCAPPDNRPNREELEACRPFFHQTLELCRPRVVLALGGMAWNATIEAFIELNQMQRVTPRPKFAHAAKLNVNQRLTLLASYHPSQQNTFTGRLTEKMLDQVFANAKRLIKT